MTDPPMFWKEHGVKTFCSRMYTKLRKHVMGVYRALKIQLLWFGNFPTKNMWSHAKWQSLWYALTPLRMGSSHRSVTTLSTLSLRFFELTRQNNPDFNRKRQCERTIYKIQNFPSCDLQEIYQGYRHQGVKQHFFSRHCLGWTKSCQADGSVYSQGVVLWSPWHAFVSKRGTWYLLMSGGCANTVGTRPSASSARSNRGYEKHAGKKFNTLRPRQNGRLFADDIFKCIF